MGFGKQSHDEKKEMEQKKVSEEGGQTEKEERKIEIEVKEDLPAPFSAPHASEFIVKENADSTTNEV